jgi:uncharacterized protein with ParB-like and HNH nuclease domain
MGNKFTSKIYSIKKLDNLRFVIPSYQRPYVWGNEQINKLLSDFYDAYSRGDEYYYIGTVLLADGESAKELIDGQQRFTTLWLIAASFKILQKDADIENFLKVNDELRLDFAIRKQIKLYFEELYNKKEYSEKEIEKIKTDEYLVNIATAVTTILGTIRTFSFQFPKNIEGLGKYIYQYIYFVVNTVPPKTDMNKLFQTINNSGLQLEQSDILKSLLLKRIETGKSIYSRMWEACENMNNYFERNVRTIFPDIKWDFINFDDLKTVEILNLTDDTISINKTDNEYTIDDILNDRVSIGQNEEKIDISFTDKSTESETIIYCRSIISFPQLLLHTYRIFLFNKAKTDFELPFHSKNLLKIFEPLSKNDSNDIEHEIKEFIQCLWSVRYIFDKEVVKWIQNEDKDNELLLTNISKNDFSRSVKGKTDISMLQSMMYFTGNYNTQIWLSPYLKRLLDGEDSLTCLENIDNALSLSISNDKETSYKLTDKNCQLSDFFDFENYLKESKGVSFRHYWFQKLEYILWKEFNSDEKYKQDQKFKTYRITSKNSVEHVFPQNHEYGEMIDEMNLNSFGNLALLSVSQNSSYSNQKVEKKKIDFDNKPTYDSLKLKFIYESNELENYEKIITPHRDLMIDKIKKHYKKR